MRTVAAVIDQGALTFDLAIPCEVFGVDRRDIVEPWYEFLVVAAGTTPVRTQTGFTIDTRHRLRDLDRAETIVVPGWSDPDDRPSAGLCAALRRGPRARRADRLALHRRLRARRRRAPGRAPGDHPLALLRPAAGALPGVDLDPDVLYVVDGQVMTSAGTAAGIDLCLHIVALDHGVHVANRVARRIVMPPYRAGGQAQYVEQPVDPAPGPTRSRSSSTGPGTGSATACRSTTSPAARR